MKCAFLIGAVAAVALSGSVAAQAGAFTAVNAAATTANPEIILVAGGCGMGFHRGPYGHCRRNGPHRVYYGVGSGSAPRTTATGGNAGGYSSRN